ncbi:MAG: 3-oxoacyl-ACP synthase, partial [Myxococcales bacterium]|nr:3-oxoacyl-ACP synthase [Myxococcales bacterium]
FGDGAGAAVVATTDEDRGVLGSVWGADGSLASCLYQPAGGTQMPASHETVAEKLHTVHMQGSRVFRHAVECMSGAVQTIFEQAQIGPDDVDLLIPHQANTRIMEATRSRIGIPIERLYSIVERYGNMSAASIPIAIDEAREHGRLKDGDLLLTTAFGTGFTWAAHALRM